MQGTNFCLKTPYLGKAQACISLKVKQQELARDRHLGPYQHNYQIYSKYFKAYRSYGSHKQYPVKLIKWYNYGRKNAKFVNHARDIAYTFRTTSLPNVFKKISKVIGVMERTTMCLWTPG